MSNEMTPLEAAENLKWNAEHMFCNENLDDRESANACNLAASYLRAIAAGEYKRVVHAHWKTKDFSLGYQHFIHSVCSNCGNDIKFSAPTEYCSRCGARMDEKALEECDTT